MKKLYFLMVLILFFSKAMFAQISINTDGTQPDGSAMLEIKSDHSGLLPPRMTHTAMNGISSPANGLVVYCSDCPGLYIYLNGNWNKVRLDCEVPAPAAGTQVPSSTQIVWNWNAVTGATGYKWNTVNDYFGGTNMGTTTTKTETGLSCNTSYSRYVWAYNDCGYSPVTSLNGQTSAPCITSPVVTTLYPTQDVTQTSATSGGNVTSDGGSPVTVRGVCWSATSGTPDTNGSHTRDGSGTGSFNSYLTGLQAGTMYHVRAYATNSAGTGYAGDFVFFTTPSFTLGQNYGGGLIFYLDPSGQSGLISADQPDQSTGAQWGCEGNDIPGCHGTAIGTGQANTTAIVNGCSDAGIAAKLCNDLVRNYYDDWFLPSLYELNQMYLNLKVNNLGGFANGYYWSSSEGDALDAWIKDFTHGYQFGNIAKTTPLHVRAARAFSTTATLPSVTTAAIMNITQNTATGGGNVTSDGGTPVTARGVCWGTSSNPDINGDHTSDAGGSFVSNLTGMSAKTTYYARAYATNSFGTSYGDQVSFTTLTFAIGQPYQGGRIFYIDGTGQHGLIAATDDQSAGIRWYAGTNTNTMALADGVYAGKTNTALIIASQGNGDGNTYAARVCNEFTVQVGNITYGDWYLPSKFELNLMYLNKTAIGGFANDVYWSSTEVNDGNAWIQTFVDGNQFNHSKYYAYPVRAIRAF